MKITKIIILNLTTVIMTCFFSAHSYAALTVNNNTANKVTFIIGRGPCSIAFGPSGVVASRATFKLPVNVIKPMCFHKAKDGCTLIYQCSIKFFNSQNCSGYVARSESLDFTSSDDAVINLN